jgi:murein DD-endopeptidase MepM/ murein hydrolase activator NlpD
MDNTWLLTRIGLICSLFFALPVSSTAGEQKLVKISTQKQDGATEFFVENLQHAEVTITIEMEIKNLTCSGELPFTATIPPKEKISVFTLRQTDAGKDSSWSYTYYATWGSLTATHDDSAAYILPFAPGQSYPVSQGFHGKYSHTGGDCYSIDFKMPEGTPIHAARGGVVVGVKSDSNVGGPDKKFEWDANFILIKHDDGTFGHYVHLKKDGARVKIGQTVRTGELIGLSGNTGHSTGPHLHFAVFKAANGKQRQTIPVKYRTTPAIAEVLTEGRVYRAF